jgi:hypothetical protein
MVKLDTGKQLQVVHSLRFQIHRNQLLDTEDAGLIAHQAMEAQYKKAFNQFSINRKWKLHTKGSI